MKNWVCYLKTARTVPLTFLQAIKAKVHLKAISTKATLRDRKSREKFLLQFSENKKLTWQLKVSEKSFFAKNSTLKFAHSSLWNYNPQNV